MDKKRMRFDSDVLEQAEIAMKRKAAMGMVKAKARAKTKATSKPKVGPAPTIDGVWQALSDNAQPQGTADYLLKASDQDRASLIGATHEALLHLANLVGHDSDRIEGLTTAVNGLIAKVGGLPLGRLDIKWKLMKNKFEMALCQVCLVEILVDEKMLWHKTEGCCHAECVQKARAMAVQAPGQ